SRSGMRTGRDANGVPAAWGESGQDPLPRDRVASSVADRDRQGPVAAPRGDAPIFGSHVPGVKLKPTHAHSTVQRSPGTTRNGAVGHGPSRVGGSGDEGEWP